MKTSQKIGLVLGPLSFALILLFLPTSVSLTIVGKKVLACMAWMVIWWSTNPVSLGQTALLPIILFPLLGLTDEGISGTAGFVNNTVLFTTTIFWLGSAIEKWNLHRRIAFSILSVVGTKPLSILMAFSFVSAVLSMWMSNTACTAMMIPLIAGLTLSVKEYDPKYAVRLGAGLMMAVAFSATNGGTATPIGNNANITGMGMIREMTGAEIDFPHFMLFAVPICMVMVLVTTIVIYYTLALHKTEVKINREYISTELHNLGPMTTSEKWVFGVLITAIICWMTKTLWASYLPSVQDYMIGAIGVAILFLVPSKEEPGEPILPFKYALSHTSWDAVFLIGGSLVLGSGFANSGLTDWVAKKLGVLGNLPEFAMLIAFAVIASLLTELGSNIVVVAVFIPIAASVAEAAGYSPMVAMINIIFSCGFAFMLPQGTPPNALAAGSGLLENNQMLKTGTVVKIAVLIVYSIMYVAVSSMGLVNF